MTAVSVVIPARDAAERIERTLAALVQGRVEPDSDHPPGAFDHTITVRSETLLYETANLFVRREWFDRVAGFKAFIDPADGHFGEDVVFAWSARRLGARSAFAA